MKTVLDFLKSNALRHGYFLMFCLALIDAFFFAMPVTTAFIIMGTIKKININKCILSALAGTLAGALAGYTLGYLVLFKGDVWLTATAQSVMDNSAGFSVNLYYEIRKIFLSRGFLVLLAAPFSPLPYGMFSITSGLLKINMIWFLILTIISHSVKYIFLAYFVVRAENKIKGIFASRKRRYSEALPKTI